MKTTETPVLYAVPNGRIKINGEPSTRKERTSIMAYSGTQKKGKKKITWSPEEEQRLYDLQDNIETKWGIDMVEDFQEFLSFKRIIQENFKLL